MSIKQFPAELRALPQWCVATLLPTPEGKDDKRPYDPKTGKPASVTDKTTWGTFDEALVARDAWRSSSAPRAQMGFVFSRDDPYAVIDLDTYKAKDDKIKSLHGEIKRHAATYTELSQSGLGTHIIGRGWVAEGAHNEANALEIYSHARFMICTGDVGVEGLIQPVVSIQELLDYLYPLVKDGGKAGATHWRDLGDGEESLLTDQEVIDRAMAAENADKFLALCQGDLSLHGGDHSRADEALIQFLCFYTPDNRQVARLFMMSDLAKREKAQRSDYVPRTIAFARMKIKEDQPPPLDVPAITERAKQVASPKAKKPAPANVPVSFPPGLVGEIAKYVLASATRPVPEIALATAIACVAGIVGRNYNCSSPPTGLNLYILLLAKTGTGKESIQSSIDRLFAEVQKTVPPADRFLGPARFASGQALVKQFQAQPCFVSILGEFGDTMKRMTARGANGAEIALLQNMKDIFHKSGWNQWLRATVHSDKEKNTTNVHAPALTILGETAPEPFFAGLDEELISGGFLPRFLCIEYLGDRPDRNATATSKPPPELVQKTADLIASVLQMEQNQTCTMVHADAAGTKMLDDFDKWVDEQMRGSSETTRQLWNRAHIKALRLSALIAVGVNPYEPVVTPDLATWAIEMVRQDVAVLLDRFMRGDVGEGDAKLHADLVSVISKYMANGSPRYEEFHARGCVSSRFLQQQTANRAAFKKHRLGASKALEDTLAIMVKYGVLTLVDKKTAQDWFKTSSTVYALGDQWDA